MELDSNAWIDLWSDHSMTTFHEDSDAVLPRNAQAMEMVSMDGLLDGVLKLFRINLEKGLGRIPRGLSLPSGVVGGSFSDHPGLPASSKFLAFRNPVKASLERSASLKLVGVKPSSKPHDHRAQTGDGHGAPASAAHPIHLRREGSFVVGSGVREARS